ncbi:MAG: CHAD domain-containing protein [bacterium]
MQKTDRAGYSRKDSALETARRLLWTQYLLIQHHAGLASRRHSIRAVHDLRVAVRRFRTALRVFDCLLQGTSASLIRRQLRTLNRRLGPVRDVQVWILFLRKAARRENAPLPAGWDSGLREQERALDRILDSSHGRNVQERCARLLRLELTPERIAQSQAGASRPFLANKLCRAYEHILQIGDAPALATPEAAHTLRRRCRRARYLSEFAEPVIKGHIPKLTRRLKRVADALGDWRDAGGYAARLKELAAPPPGLRHLVVNRQKRAHREFVAAWRQLTAPHFQKRVLADLQAAIRRTQ